YRLASRFRRRVTRRSAKPGPRDPAHGGDLTCNPDRRPLEPPGRMLVLTYSHRRWRWLRHRTGYDVMRSRPFAPCLPHEHSSTTSPTARPADERPRHILAALSAGLGLSALAACASVPEVNSVVESPRVASTSPTLVSANGPLTPQESRVVLSRVQQ